MSASKLDAVYRSILITKFFTKGWGKPENLRRLFEFRKIVSNRDECYKLIERDYPVTITKEQNLTDCKLIEGYFTTPLEKFLPGIVPEVVQKAHFQALLPLHWPDPVCKPMCLHHAGTGDHFFWRRRNLMVKPLLKEAGIGGIILENPFYGLRKPTDQVRSSLHNVSDIFVMGGCLILESLVLFHWCERNGLGPLGVTGLSMGGHMASLAATNWPKPLVLVPCLSWSTASAVFLQGVMAQSINWDLLEDQYLSDGQYREKLAKMVTIVDEAFLAGKKFAKNFPHNIELPASAPPTKPVADVKCETEEPDITYKESKKLKLEKYDENKTVPSTDKSLDSLKEELDKLLEGNKISKSLYKKLTAKEKFELSREEIEEINKLHVQKITDLLVKYKLVDSKRILTEKPVLNANMLVPTKDSIPTELKEEVILKSTDKPKTKPWSVSDLADNLWTNFPFIKSKSGRKIDISKINWRDREALQFMRGIMDECTHLSNFSVPFDTSLIIAVCAKHDAYVPRDDVGTLEEIWPGAAVRYVDAGHVSAYILHQGLFRSCIIEAFERSKKSWKEHKHID